MTTTQGGGNSGSGGSTTRYSKISSAEWKWGLDERVEGADSLDEKLEHLYTVEGEGYRGIAKYYNALIVKSALEDAGNPPLAGQAEWFVEILREERDGINKGDVQDARESLKQQGVMPDEVEKLFISHQTIGNYLQDELGITPKKRTTNDKNAAVSGIRGLVSRLKRYTVRTLNSLDDSGVLTVGDIDVSVTATVRCRDCGSSYNVFTLIENDGCDCSESSQNTR